MLAFAHNVSVKSVVLEALAFHSISCNTLYNIVYCYCLVECRTGSVTSYNDWKLDNYQLQLDRKKKDREKDGRRRKEKGGGVVERSRPLSYSRSQQSSISSCSIFEIKSGEEKTKEQHGDTCVFLAV